MTDLLDEYALSTQLVSDGEPVRCVAVHDSNSSSSPSSAVELVSGSQGGIISRFVIADDATCAAKSEGSEDNNNTNEPLLEIQPGGAATRHPHQITAILSSTSYNNSNNNNSCNDSTSAASSASLPNVYITGCKDGNIRIMDGSTHELKGTLEGHSNAVTSLSWVAPPSSQNNSENNSNNTLPWLVSGSWDGTARLWNILTSTCLGTLSGHENTVSVAGLPSSNPNERRVVTVSAGFAEGNVIRDHTVRIWKLTSSSDGYNVQSEILSKVANDHGGPIRDVCYDPDTRAIYTCSNDGTVKIRSEKNGQCITTLAYPGENQPMLLSVCVVGDADSKAVVAGAEDGNVVVWDVSERGREVQVIGHPGCVWSVSPLNNNNANNNTDFITACHDGNIRTFTRHPSKIAPPSLQKSFSESVTAAQSTRSSGPTPEEIAKLPQWSMNALTQGRSEGQVQVFQKDGKAIAAQWSASSKTWIEVGEVTGTNANSGMLNGKRYDHVLPIEVDVPGGGVQKLQIGYNNGENPFVTAQAFIDEHMLDQAYLSQIADYIRQRAGDAGTTIGMGGASSGSGGGSAPSSAFASNNEPTPMEVTPTYDHLPMKGYKIFDAGIDKKGLNKVVQKIREFNDSTDDNKLSPNESQDLLDSLSNTLSITNRYHSSTISISELATIRKMILEWDASRAFPALDLARMVVLHPDAAKGELRGYWEEVLDGALNMCLGLGDEIVGEVAVPMLTMRLVANCFKGGVGSADAAGSLVDRIMDCAEACAPSNNKNVRLSVATAVLNTSSYMHASDNLTSPSSAVRVLDVVGNIAGCGKYESEAIVRSLVALGTVLLLPGDGGSEAKRVAKERCIGSMVERVAGMHGDMARVVAKEILSILAK